MLLGLHPATIQQTWEVFYTYPKPSKLSKKLGLFSAQIANRELRAARVARSLVRFRQASIRWKTWGLGSKGIWFFTSLAVPCIRSQDPSERGCRHGMSCLWFLGSIVEICWNAWSWLLMSTVLAKHYDSNYTKSSSPKVALVAFPGWKKQAVSVCDTRHSKWYRIAR